MTAAAALAFGGLFMSCSHDDITTGNGSISVIDNYEQAFISRFGQPAANQTWGFETTEQNAALTRSSAVVTGDPFTFENTDGFYINSKSEISSTAKTYAEAVEAATQHYSYGDQFSENDFQNATEVILPEGTYAIHWWMNSHTLYITGNVTLNVSESNSINKAKIYLLNGSTLTLNMSNYINSLEIYVAERATLNYNYDKLYYQTGPAKIYNRGTVNLKNDNFEVNQNAVFYNEGTVNGKNITSKPGDGNSSFFYNFGEVNLRGDFQLNSCANFYNEGTFTVAGGYECTQGNSLIWWINKGTFTSKTFKSAAWNGTHYNYCQLFVSQDAMIQNGVFHLMDNSYAEFNRGIFNNLKFEMGNNAGLNIKSGTKWGRDGADFRGKYDIQGFEATNSAKAYVRLGGDNYIPDHKGSAFHLKGVNLTLAYENITFYSTFSGPKGENAVYQWDNMNYSDVSTEESLREAKSENSTWNTHDVTNIITGADFAKTGFTLKDGECAATWKPGTRTPGEGIRIIAEDLTVGEYSDFDFNDVVFDVEFDEDRNKTVITLQAAGGTLPLTVGWEGNDDSTDGTWKNYEVHYLFGFYSTGVMINTGNEYSLSAAPVTLTLNGLYNKNANNIPVKVKKNGEWITLTAVRGKVASKICVTTDYEWCDERDDIETVYPAFPQWVKDGVTQWY